MLCKILADDIMKYVFFLFCPRKYGLTLHVDSLREVSDPILFRKKNQTTQNNNITSLSSAEFAQSMVSFNLIANSDDFALRKIRCLTTCNGKLNS